MRCLTILLLFALLTGAPVTRAQAGRSEITGVVIKRIFFGETMNVELRAEAFNVTNTPPLAAPNTVVGAPGFGSITAAGDPRVFQLGAKFNF